VGEKAPYYAFISSKKKKESGKSHSLGIVIKIIQ
jgi:hypothetical protein